MSSLHLSEPEIQEYALYPLQCKQESIDHVRSCSACSSRVEMYTSIFAPIKELQPGTFDFNVSELVLAAIKPGKRSPAFPLVPMLIIIAFCTLLLSLSFLLLRKKSLLTVFTNTVDHTMLYAIAGGGFLVVVFHITEQLLKFGKRMRQLQLE